MAKPKDQQHPLTQSPIQDAPPLPPGALGSEPDPIKSPPLQPQSAPDFARRSVEEDAGPPSDPQARRRGPTLEEMQDLVDELSIPEIEQLMALMNKRLGREGKAPTGRWIVKHGIKLGKKQRIRAGTILEKDALTKEQIADFEKHGAIEAEHA